jgi:hypothetical protein
MSQAKDPNQGEGDRISARRYDKHVEEFVSEGHVADAAKEAKDYVESHPDEASKAERAAKRGPKGHILSVDEIVSKGQSVVDRVRPMVDRALGSLRARFGRK